MERGEGELPLVPIATALTVSLVGLYVLCLAAAKVWPDQLAHGWLALFSREPVLGLREIIQGVLGSAAAAWAAALMFVPVYNWLIGRRRT